MSHVRAGLALMALAGSVLLAGCTPAQQDDLTRRAAKSAITPVLVERFPGIPLEPALDCVLDNASRSELLSLAADSVTGPTASTIEIVTRIVERPATINCLATEGVAGLMRGVA